MTIKYVAGFLHDDERVVLIEKNRPDWQAGKLNGIGGKIEVTDIDPADAMSREFREETGVLIYPKYWQHALTLNGTQSTIYSFGCYDTEGLIDKVRTVEDEKVIVVSLKSIANYNTVPNVQWIVPLVTQRGAYEPIDVNFY